MGPYFIKNGPIFLALRGQVALQTQKLGRTLMHIWACLHNKVHIYELILSKLCTCIIDKKISLKFENGNDMIVGSGVIAP